MEFKPVPGYKMLLFTYSCLHSFAQLQATVMVSCGLLIELMTLGEQALPGCSEDHPLPPREASLHRTGLGWTLEEATELQLMALGQLRLHQASDGQLDPVAGPRGREAA